MAALAAQHRGIALLPLCRIGHATGEETHGWELVSHNTELLTTLIVLQVVLLLTSVARYWLAFRMLSQAVQLTQTILFAAASVLTQLIGFAPGGLGATEAIVGAVAGELGFDLTISVAAVVLDRLVSTVVILVVGGASSLVLGRRLASGPSRPDEPNAS